MQPLLNQNIEMPRLIICQCNQQKYIIGFPLLIWFHLYNLNWQILSPSIDIRQVYTAYIISSITVCKSKIVLANKILTIITGWHQRGLSCFGPPQAESLPFHCPCSRARTFSRTVKIRIILQRPVACPESWTLTFEVIELRKTVSNGSRLVLWKSNSIFITFYEFCL